MDHFSWPTTFGLSKNPFKDTLDTGLFFRTRQHEEALIKLRIGIEDRHALVLLTGVSGTGKTLVSQVVLRNLENSRFIPAFVLVYPQMGKGALLGAMLEELGVETLTRTTHGRLRQLQEQALALHARGQQLAIIVDEAHFLKADALHLLRSLSNLESEEEKLITVVLIAEENLRRRMRAPSYASLRSRITFQVDLQPLSRAETEQYIKYRLLKCGAYADFLADEVYEMAHRLTGGIPRELNRLLYNGFMEAMTTEYFAVTPEMLQTVGQKMGLS
ncbi:MAG: AAA family ATPase [Deltaproteobacteria bacterium]|jgi:general secretion pathway protein A